MGGYTCEPANIGIPREFETDWYEKHSCEVSRQHKQIRALLFQCDNVGLGFEQFQLFVASTRQINCPG